MTKICSIVILFFCVLAGSVSSAGGQMTDLEGEWINVDLRTRGLTRLVISKTENGWSIGASGKCHPKDCSWGAVVLAPLGESVEDYSFARGFAVWKAGFATKYMTLTLSNGQLTAEIITIFCDRSGRANTRRLDVLQRADQAAE
jgi:hypothetical protein